MGLCACVMVETPTDSYIDLQGVGAQTTYHRILMVFPLFPSMGTSDRGDFWAYPVEILVFASPTGYMLTSSGFLY